LDTVLSGVSSRKDELVKGLADYAGKLLGPLILSLAGGALITLAGVELSIANLRSSTALVFSSSADLAIPVGAVLQVAGVLVLVNAMLFYLKPELHQAWGALIVVSTGFATFTFSGISVPILTVGWFLSFAGGLVGIVLKPETKRQLASVS